MIKLGESDIIAVYQGDTPIDMVYSGNTLVFGAPFVIKGKFTDDSTADDWWMYYTPTSNSQTPAKISIAEFVNPTTKEFEFKGMRRPKSISNLFRENAKIERIDKIKGAVGFISIDRAFYKCSALKSLNLAGVDSSLCTSFTNLFVGCENIEILDLSGFDLRQAVGIGSLFSGCTSLKEIILGEYTYTTKATTAYALYERCGNIEKIDMSWFRSDVATSLQATFNQCRKVKTLDISHIKTPLVTTFYQCFYSCDSLVELKCNLDFSSVTNVNSIVYNCMSLTDIIGSISNLSIKINLHYSPLTNESAMLFINGLAQVDTTQTITFSQTTYNTLTDEQIAIATSKGWDVVRG